MFDGPIRGVVLRFPRSVHPPVTCVPATIDTDRSRRNHRRAYPDAST